MKKNLIIAICVFALGLIIIASIQSKKSSQSVPVFDPQNTTFSIEGTNVHLVNGISEVPVAPGSASKVSTLYFGNEAMGDLNGDRVPDYAFLVTQTSGGSGNFFYVVAALSAGKNTYKLTDALFIGDRIAPQTTEIRDNKLLVNYADRKEGEPMTAQPSVGKTLYLEANSSGMLQEKVK